MHTHSFGGQMATQLLKALKSNNLFEWAYDVVVSMFDFHRRDRGSNPGRGGKIS